MRNILVPSSVVEHYLVSTGQPFPADRCTGRSTIQALKVIVAAMSNPNTPQSVPYDHHACTHTSKLHMLNTIQYNIHKLELFGFTFNKKDMTITYSIWVED